ncbi:CG6321, partial [Drosophila busckii]
MSAHNQEAKLKHLFDGGPLNVYQQEILNLGVGAPGTDLLEPCCEIFQQATTHCLSNEQKYNQSLIFQYGPSSGDYEARYEIAKYLSEKYDNAVHAKDLIITAGATQGLHFVLSTLIDFNGFIFVDEYTYMIALDAMQQFTSIQIVPLKLNEDGVDLEDLEQKARDRVFKSKNKDFWAMYYAIPTYHNPTGILFSPAVCRGIVQLARKYDFLVLCDDVYNILHYGEKPEFSRLMSYDDPTAAGYTGNVISNGSFSKIIGPGVRLGWLEVPGRLKPQLISSGIINSGGCFNNYTVGILRSLFQMQLVQPHIERLYKAYKERMMATISVLNSELPDGCSMQSPSGGYFIWIQLPAPVDVRELLQYSMEHENIYFIPGTRFAVEEGKGKQCFRLSIAFHSKAKLEDGVRRLCACIKSFIQSV